MRHLTRKYIAILAFAAACVLAIGYTFRPRKTQLPPVPPDAGSMPLQRLSRDAEMQATTDFLSERIQYAEPFVFYLPDVQATGMPWTTQGVLLSTDNRDAASSAPTMLSILAIEDPEHRKLAPVGVASHVGDTTEWAALVARRQDGHLIWTPGFAGGRTAAACGGIEYHEVAFSSPVTRAFAGGGLFDLNGNLIGIVVHCGARLSLVSADEIDSLIKQNESLDSKLLKRYGIRFTPLDAREKNYFQVESGLLVKEVWAGTLAAKAGLQPGDIVTKLNGQPVLEPSDLTPLTAPASSADAILTIHAAKPKEIFLSQPGAALASGPALGSGQGIQLEAPQRGVAIADIPVDSPAYKAGLRPGDRVVRIGSLKNPAREPLEKSLARAGSDPFFLVFDRGPMQRGVLLP